MRYSIDGENGFGDGGVEACPDWPTPIDLEIQPDISTVYEEPVAETLSIRARLDLNYLADTGISRLLDT